MRISDRIKSLLLQRINPLRIKINDPQKLGYHSNLTDLTQVSQYLSTTLALSPISKHAFCVATFPEPKQSFNSSSFRSFEMGSTDRQRFQSFHPRNYSSSYSIVFWKRIRLDPEFNF